MDWAGGGGEDLKFPSASTRYSRRGIACSERSGEIPPAPDNEEVDPSVPSCFGTWVMGGEDRELGERPLPSELESENVRIARSEGVGVLPSMEAADPSPPRLVGRWVGGGGDGWVDGGGDGCRTPPPTPSSGGEPGTGEVVTLGGA
jgi:hypothetical protein